jgi:hypothetical protein
LRIERGNMAASKNVRTEFTAIEAKLDQLIILVAALVSAQVVEDPNVTQAAPRLKKLKLSNTQIATVLNKTPHIIGVRLAEAGKNKAKRKPK